MSPRPTAPRATIAAFTAVVLTALSVAVPLLDQGRHHADLRVAEAGTPAGYVDHHHGVCLQHSAAAWSAARGADLPAELLVREAEPLRDATHRAGHSDGSLHRSRAPPVV